MIQIKLTSTVYAMVAVVWVLCRLFEVFMSGVRSELKIQSDIISHGWQSSLLLRPFIHKSRISE
jgi:hypothetical protein